MATKNDLVNFVIGEKGYLEKSKANYQKYGADCLYPKTQYAGSDNYTKYAYEVDKLFGESWRQGQAWCQVFVAYAFWKVFGKTMADKLLYGELDSAYTIAVKNKFVSKGRQVALSKAEPGDLVYRSRNGGGHVGIVIGMKNGQIVSVEGNSSASDITSWNGGAVVEHTGATWEWCVRPDWSMLPKDDGWHWVKSGGKWYYQDANGVNKHGWAKIKETGGETLHWYYFDSKGAMLTGHQFIDGELCLFMPEGTLEGAMCISDENGYQHVWNVL